MKVSLYVREHGSRQFTKVNKKKIYPEGTIYVLRYQQRWHTIPGCTSITLALTAQKQKELELLQGAPVKTVKTPTERVTFTAAVKKYLAYISKVKRKKTYLAYSLTLRLFVPTCTKEFLDEITKDDLRNFEAVQCEAGFDLRTIDNRLTNLISFFRHHGINDVKHHCAYVERKVKANDDEQLAKLFDASTPDELELWQFFLGTGFREQEVSHAHYTDIDWKLRRIVPRCKPEHGDWIPKDKDERSVPLPAELIASLLARRKRASAWGGSDGLIFPNGQGGVEGHYLRLLQNRAKAAGLNVSDYTLHRLRKTFATWHYRRGVSERTIQKWLGHSDLTTTQLYLADEKDNTPEIREKVDSTFTGFMGPRAPQTQAFAQVM